MRVKLLCALVTVSLLSFIAGAQEKPPKPDWLGTAAGKTDEVLPPFTPLEVQSGPRILCWNREYVFDGHFLPSQVTSGGEPLLADSAKLLATFGNVTEDLAALSPEVTRKAKNRIEMAASGERAGVKLKAASWIEEDGFWWTTLELLPNPEKTLDRLVLEIPVRREIAKYIHPAALDWTLATGSLTDAGWKDKFWPILSLVNDDKGIAWYCESPAGWRPAGKTLLRVDVTVQTATLRCELIGKPTSLKEGLTYSFGLQACPVKPIPADWRSRRICHGANLGMAAELDRYVAAGVTSFTNRGDWIVDYGEPYTSCPEQLHNMVKACHAHGIKFLLNMGYGVGDLAPETKLYGAYWNAMPLVHWSHPSMSPHWAFNMRCCGSSYWTDFILDGIQKTVNEFDTDGFYYDGTDEPFPCENQVHGCGYVDEQGKLHQSYPLLVTRAFAKRMYAMTKQHRLDTIIDCHSSNNVYPMRAAWVDQLWNGEQFEELKPGFHFPMDYFRAQCVGKQYGVPEEFLVYEKRPFELQEALSFALLHDVRIRPSCGQWDWLDAMSRIWKVEDAFGIAQAEWLPYWKNAAEVQVTTTPAEHQANEGGMASLYLIRGKRALMVLSNIQTQPATVAARLDLKGMGLSETAHARDAQSQAPIPVTDATIAIPLKGYDYRLIWVE